MDKMEEPHTESADGRQHAKASERKASEDLDSGPDAKRVKLKEAEDRPPTSTYRVPFAERVCWPGSLYNPKTYLTLLEARGRRGTQWRDPNPSRQQ